MDASGLLIFAGALTVAAGSPGPSVAALVARVIARGWRDVIPFAAAMWLGEALWLTLAVYGLAALAEALHGVFQVVKYLGVTYLLYLAWKIWCAPVAIVSDGPAPRPGGCGMFLAGLAVTLGNPKIMVFYLALLPTIIDLAGVTLGGVARAHLHHARGPCRNRSRLYRPRRPRPPGADEPASAPDRQLGARDCYGRRRRDARDAVRASGSWIRLRSPGSLISRLGAFGFSERRF
jgi:threonine/homoserine/homoserine lactone efflux protein